MNMNKDVIYRQEAIDAMANTLWHYPNECYRNLNVYEFARGLAELGLKSVPSAQPERKTGKWTREVLGSTSGYGTTVMYQCSECDSMAVSKYRYCPNCGCAMKGDNDA